MSPPPAALSLSALLSLPARLCNPPPAAGNVRSCKVTPLLKVSLDDVLRRRHLPPLTLKDFEEWLVFVDGGAQHLYFLLWLAEYEARYAAWVAASGYTPAADHAYTNLIAPSPALALFFTRAKQTFLLPRAPHALGPAALAALSPAGAADPAPLPPALLVHPHPPPPALAPLAQHARRALREPLARFAAGACQNVGSRRAWCGVAGGSVIALAAGVAPALAVPAPRWWRLVGWLGLWLGGTIVLASLHGICMMIYVFGDLRQLRAFELARPPISPPRAVARARPRLRSYFTRSPAPPQSEKSDWTASFAGPAAAETRSSSSGTRAEEPADAGAIEISPAYYPDGTGPRAPGAAHTQSAARSWMWRSAARTASDDLEKGAAAADDFTAAFIPPAHAPAAAPDAPARVQFDFAALPRAQAWWDTCPRHPDLAAAPSPSPPQTPASSATFAPALPPPPKAVPAFAPVTRVLAPAAARAQWEVVVRSAGIAALGAGAVVGGLVALPVGRR